MPYITKDATREIIDDYVKLIEQSKQPGAKPEKEVINFRNDMKNGTQRDVYEVPLKYLRYRKDNGRIRSDIISFEKDHGKLDETKTETQEIVRNFLWKKDPDNTNILRKSIKHQGQDRPAIITCDGFLINGNRRKMVFEELQKENPQLYSMMKVVILPGKDDPGGPPTIQEIEHLENRYQLQRDGKSEYAGLDMALSIRRKIEMGMTLEEQLRDDPNFVELSSKDFIKKVREYEANYLKPLECADRYLKYLGREFAYENISTGITDKDGKWQAFIEYSNFYENQLKDPKWRIETDIDEDEIGRIEDIAFKIIRKHSIKDFRRKLYELVRDLKKLLSVPNAKSELIELGKKVNNKVSNDERHDKDGKEYSLKEIDNNWSSKYDQLFAKHIRTAYSILDEDKEAETPISLLEASLNKLNHYNMIVENIKPSERKKGIKMAEDIRDKADEIKTLIWELIKNKN